MFHAHAVYVSYVLSRKLSRIIRTKTRCRRIFHDGVLRSTAYLMDKSRKGSTMMCQLNLLSFWLEVGC